MHLLFSIKNYFSKRERAVNKFTIQGHISKELSHPHREFDWSSVHQLLRQTPHFPIEAKKAMLSLQSN